MTRRRKGYWRRKLDPDLFALLKKCLVGIGAEAGSVGYFEEITFVAYAAGDGVGLVAKHTGVHIVEDDVVVCEGEMGEGGKCDAAFQHAAHHTGDIVLFANGIDAGCFEEAAGFGEFDIDVVAGFCGDEAKGVVMVEDAFVGHKLYRNVLS